MEPVKPLRVYMCDLTHDTVVLVSDTIPINIGFIASYAKKRLGAAIDISLYKYPDSVIKAIEAWPPDVIALSNYSWNSKLSERIAKLAKLHNPLTITAQGGTNFPHKAREQLGFLLSRPATDVYVELEGEVAFSLLLERVLTARTSAVSVLDDPIPGCVYVAPATQQPGGWRLIKGDLPPRLHDLDEIPSPYLNGMLERFFDGRLTPFLETNRGCPFKCTFCHTGADYFQKINNFSLQRITDEIDYIAPRAASLGIVNLHLADTNFGMYPRDRTICETLLASQQKYGWPRQIMATTGKNNKERVIDITRILGNTFSVNMSVQSMDRTVLTNIKRDNIRLDDYTKVNQHLNEQGRATKGEVIVGLPGETRESFTKGLESIIAAGVSSVCSYTLMLLHGTEFKDPDYRQLFGIRGKYRIVPLNFGEYAGERVFDTEEVGITTTTMTFDDYLWIRGLSLIVEVLHNNRPFEELVRYGLSLGLDRFELIKLAYDRLARAPESIRTVVAQFMAETRSELWNSEEELEAFSRLDENYTRLLRGEAGGNLIYKYKAMSLAFCNQDWAEYLRTILWERVIAIKEAERSLQAAERELASLAEYVQNRLAGVLDVNANLETRAMASSYDIHAWLHGPLGSVLGEYALPNKIGYVFEFTGEQLAVRQDQFKRYGTDPNALSKIVTRVSNVESLFRRVRAADGPPSANESDADQNDQFIRYTLSN